MNKKRMRPKRWQQHHIQRKSTDGIGDVSVQLQQGLMEWAQDTYMTAPGVYAFNWDEITQEGLNMGLSQNEVTQVISNLKAAGSGIAPQAMIPTKPTDDPGEGFEYVLDEATQQWMKMAKRASIMAVIDKLTIASEFRDELNWTVKGGVDIKVGDTVYVRPMRVFGQVIRTVGDMYKVQMGERVSPYWKQELELSKR